MSFRWPGFMLVSHIFSISPRLPDATSAQLCLHCSTTSTSRPHSFPLCFLLLLDLLFSSHLLLCLSLRPPISYPFPHGPTFSTSICTIYTISLPNPTAQCTSTSIYVSLGLSTSIYQSFGGGRLPIVDILLVAISPTKLEAPQRFQNAAFHA